MAVRIGGPEFGEIYHAAAFVAMSPDSRVVVVGPADQWSAATDYLNAVSAGSATLVSEQPLSATGPGSIADAFVQEASHALPGQVAAKLAAPLDGIPDTIVALGEPVVAAIGAKRACLLWIRNGDYEPSRNMSVPALEQLTSLLQDVGVRPILVGDRIDGTHPAADNLVEFYLKDGLYRNPLQQMQLLSWICDKADIRFSIGMKSGGMDGLAFTRQLPTFYIGSPAFNGRMDKVSAVFPAFRLVPITYEGVFDMFSPVELKHIRGLAS